MGVIKNAHKVYREANLAAFKKRHRGSRFAGTAKAVLKGGRGRTQ